MASLLLGSAGRVLRRSIPQVQASLFPRSPRLLSDGVGRIEHTMRFSSKPNMRNTNIGDGQRMCKCANNHMPLESFQVSTKSIDELEKWTNKRERVLICVTIPMIALFIWSKIPNNKKDPMEQVANENYV